MSKAIRAASKQMEAVLAPPPAPAPPPVSGVRAPTSEEKSKVLLSGAIEAKVQGRIDIL